MTTNNDLIRAERVVIDYNTQTRPGWILRDYIAEALREERARCAQLAQVVGTAHTYSEQEYASGFAAADIVARIVVALSNADQPGA